jgi:hypothetical protein
MPQVGVGTGAKKLSTPSFLEVTECVLNRLDH